MLNIPTALLVHVLASFANSSGSYVLTVLAVILRPLFDLYHAARRLLPPVAWSLVVAVNGAQPCLGCQCSQYVVRVQVLLARCSYG